MKTTLSPIHQERLRDLKELSNHGGRDQWHGLRCHHIDNGQFTATYGDLAARWGVSRSVVYSTIKKFIKLGLITAEKFERATIFTILEVKKEIETLNSSAVPKPHTTIDSRKSHYLNKISQKHVRDIHTPPQATFKYHDRSRYIVKKHRNPFAAYRCRTAINAKKR